MKNLFLVVIVVLFAIACNDTATNEAPEPVIINGKLVAADTIAVPETLTAYIYNPLEAKFDEIEIDVQEDGSFSSQIEVDGPQTIAMYGDYGTQLVVSPGDSIYLDTNSKFENINFNSTSPVNTALAKYKKNNPITDDLQSAEQMTIQQYGDFLDSTYTVLKNYNSKFLKEHEGNEILETYATSEELFYKPAKKLMYALFTRQGQLAMQDTVFMADVADIAEYKPEHVVNSNYPNLALSYYDYYLSNSAAENTAEGRNQAFISGLKSMENNDYLRNQLLYRKTVTGLEDNNIKFYETHKDDIAAILKDSLQINTIVEKYNKTKKLLDNPELPSDAVLKEFAATDPSEYLDEIIANANGKVIYIDNWATWCGPCKAEFKSASPELHEAFKDDVEFIYLCHQSKEATYLPSIAKYQIAGKHYFLQNNESQSIIQQINLEGFPTYTIINKQGEIVKSDYIHRPSYPKTKEILTELVNAAD